MNKRNFSLRYGLIIIFLIAVFMQDFLTIPAAAEEFFSRGIRDFIEAERKIYIPVFSTSSKIEIEVLEDSFLKDSYTGEKIYQLDKEKLFFVSRRNISQQKPYCSIQVFASSDKNKAEKMKNKLYEQGYNDVHINNEGNLYKIMVGRYSSKQSAAPDVQKLKKDGWQVWLKQFSQLDVNKNMSGILDNRAALYTARGNRIKTDERLNISGIFNVNGISLKGDFQFRTLNSGVLMLYELDIEYLTAHFLQLNMAKNAPGEALKAQSIIYRSYVLHMIASQGSLLENIKEFRDGSIVEEFLSAAESTKGIILTKNGSLYTNEDYGRKRNVMRPKAGIVPLAQADFSYKEIIEHYYPDAEFKDIRKIVDTEVKFTANVTSGLKFREIRQMTWYGPRIITAVEMNLKNQNLKIKPVLARGVVAGREDLADIVKEKGALAGVNGGYFHYSGRPLGLLYLDGELISEPISSRTAVLFNKDGEASISQVEWEGNAVFADGRKIKLSGINREPKAEEAVIYNNYYDDRVPPLKKGMIDIVIRKGKIIGLEKEEGSKNLIPPDGFVLRIDKKFVGLDSILYNIIGIDIKLNHKFSPDFEENNIVHALAGGPRLLKNGEIDITGSEEKFQNDILLGRAPRTALGVNSKNQLMLVTVDGRQPDFSIGMTLEEMADLLKWLGAEDAVNLDGGGSARMVIRGFTMNNPNEKRLISNGLLIDKYR
ncbi:MULTISPECIES: phosphodiester glycosidase family protein [unclassified Halanaerobium]|uniref:phosphodiester glycosidase family protein n=1 Tax=unclassified Halanaerobium TaxID=2641197 RepID=UPI000E1242D0|nr:MULTISPECIES: phosphodiester glycosidase family protein [unclassified Halanaerobium]RCW43820.1 stage II sporulation protein [Halanaerobium sp. MA284_MarDTE_T2]RCW80521.1 stage II sporulation protein [Halanaerobium sp. DL-01]